jgi:tetratricopeptide (TPR) repeat protein
MIEAGDFNVVIPRLLQAMSKYPDTDAALAARFWLGVAYEKVRGYRDAMEMFDEYLRRAPEGPYAKESAVHLARLHEEYDAQFKRPEQLTTEIKALTAALENDPADDALRLKLAGLLWQLGDYDQAGAIYAELVSRNRQFLENEEIKKRMGFLPNGQYIVLSPAEVQRRDREANPLKIHNKNHFRSGPDLITREFRFYVVTGQVMNQSDSILYGVQVIVTIYGFGGVVFDTNTVNIGTLNPGETRAFSVRFSNFENIDNIDRYECIGTYQR